jgi:glycosyltransferase involved in cell wall biosynthesis
VSRQLQVLTVTAGLAPGGTSGRILGMVTGLDRQKVRQTICLLYAEDPDQERYFGTTRPLFAGKDIPIETLGMHHPSPGSVLPRPKRLLHSLDMLRSATLRLARVVRMNDVDVIDAHMAPSTLIAGMAGKLTRTPVVATEYHIGEPAPVMLWPFVGRAALDLADAVVTDSRPRADDLKKWMYRRKSKVRVIPNGIRPPQNERSPSEVRTQFGIADDEMVVTQISTLRPHKGHRVLLDAARLILERAPKTRFLIVGFARGRDFEYVEELKAQAWRLGISERVFIGPYAGSIGDIWSVSDVHAHATLFDSLPNAIIEGMSLAKPAVVTAVGGIPDLVTHEETGLVVPPNDPQAFASAVLRVLEDEAFARRLGAAAHGRYCRGYRAEDTAQKLQTLFSEVAGAR